MAKNVTVVNVINFNFTSVVGLSAALLGSSWHAHVCPNAFSTR